MPKDYRLIIDLLKDGPKDEHVYRAQWVTSEIQQSVPFDFTPPLQKKQLDELRWYLEEFIQFPGAGDRVRARKTEQNLAEWGRWLFDTAFSGDEGKRIADGLMEDAQGTKSGGAGETTRAPCSPSPAPTSRSCPNPGNSCRTLTGY